MKNTKTTKILELFENGLTPVEIIKSTKFDYSHVYYVLRSNNKVLNKRDSIHKTLIGRKIEHLTVQNIFVKKEEDYKVYAICKCDCGKLKNIRAENLLDGTTKSCGCFSREFQALKKLWQ